MSNPFSLLLYNPCLRSIWHNDHEVDGMDVMWWWVSLKSLSSFLCVWYLLPAPPRPSVQKVLSIYILSSTCRSTSYHSITTTSRSRSHCLSLPSCSEPLRLHHLFLCVHAAIIINPSSSCRPPCPTPFPLSSTSLLSYMVIHTIYV